MYEIIKLLESTSGTNAKQQILKDNINNVLLKQVLVAALDPNINYYIKKIPDLSNIVVEEQHGIDVFLKNLGVFSDRVLTGNQAINHMAVLLANLSPEAANIAVRIIRRDLRCGIQVSTVNKVWPGLIREYQCMTAQPGTQKKLANIVFPAMAQLKSDGCRFNVICVGDDVIAKVARSGNDLVIPDAMADEYRKLAKIYGVDCVFDGELLVLDDDGEFLSRKKGNGIVTKAIRGTISDGELSRFRAQLWDVIPYEAFLSGLYKCQYKERFEKLTDTLSKGNALYSSVIETLIVDDMDSAMEHFYSMRRRGLEGSIFKNLHGNWEDKRSNNVVKMKAEEEADLEVIGWNPGAVGTKLEGKLGSLICATSDRKILVDVSGFSDECRDEIFSNISSWIGKIIVVKYNEKIIAKDGTWSLYLPRFVEERFDKNVANSFEELV